MRTPRRAAAHTRRDALVHCRRISRCIHDCSLAKIAPDKTAVTAYSWHLLCGSHSQGRAEAGPLSVSPAIYAIVLSPGHPVRICTHSEEPGRQL